MEISINNKIKSIAEHTSISVQQLLDIELPLKQKGLAVAINNTVIPKSNWDNKIISNNDNILIIRATQGG